MKTKVKNQLVNFGKKISCMSWLDQRQHHSIAYVVFDSFILFDQNQFKDLGLGLDLTNMPFLWILKGCERSKFK